MLKKIKINSILSENLCPSLKLFQRTWMKHIDSQSHCKRRGFWLFMDLAEPNMTFLYLRGWRSWSWGLSYRLLWRFLGHFIWWCTWISLKFMHFFLQHFCIHFYVEKVHFFTILEFLKRNVKNNVKFMDIDALIVHFLLFLNSF